MSEKFFKNHIQMDRSEIHETLKKISPANERFEEHVLLYNHPYTFFSDLRDKYSASSGTSAVNIAFRKLEEIQAGATSDEIPGNPYLRIFLSNESDYNEKTYAILSILKLSGFTFEEVSAFLEEEKIYGNDNELTMHIQMQISILKKVYGEE